MVSRYYNCVMPTGTYPWHRRAFSNYGIYHFTVKGYIVMTSLSEKPFLFMRHGDTAHNEDGLIAGGGTDIPLSFAGTAQSMRSQVLLRKKDVRTVCHSPLIRAVQTAERIASKQNIPMVAIPDLTDCHYGVAEGQPYHDHLLRWSYGEPIKGAEHFSVFSERAIRGVEQALTYPNPLVVAHGSIFLALIHTLRFEGSFTLPPCVPVEFYPDAKGVWRATPLLQSETAIMDLLA